MVKEALTQFINFHGVKYRIINSLNEELECKGLPNTINGRDVIHFFAGSKISLGDRLINPANETVYVIDIKTIFDRGKPAELRVFVESEAQHKTSLGIYSQLNEIRQLISSKKSKDKEQLSELINLLEKIVDSGEPIPRGKLSKFSNVMERNSWITSPIASALLSFLLLR